MVDALVVADLHLSVERPHASARFFAFLAGEARGARTLYLLGDLLEYWIGDDDLLEPDGDPVARELVAHLAALSANGTAVALQHGNRDFLIGGSFCRAAGARLLHDSQVERIGTEPVLMLHGDTLCTDDKAYLQFRREVRSAAWQERFLAQPLAERRTAMQEMRERSEREKKTKPRATMDVHADAVAAAFQHHEVRRIVHGHTHRPARHAGMLEGQAVERWVLPDWYGGGGYLRCDGRNWSLVRLPE